MSNKKITTSGFYKLSEIDSPEVIIEAGVAATFFDEWGISKNIFVWEDAKLTIVGILENQEDYQLKIIHDGKWSSSELKYILLSKERVSVKAKIHARVESNNSNTDVYVAAFVWENGFVDIDGIIDLAPGCEKMAGYLTEENIFLGTKWRVRWLPTLLVKSNDVEAGHACKIHKISDEKMFYLRSRGIKKEDASLMIIESQISQVLFRLKDVDEKLFTKKYEEILEKILT